MFCRKLLIFLRLLSKLLHGFASNFVWMFLGCTPIKFFKMAMPPLLTNSHKNLPLNHNIYGTWKFVFDFQKSLKSFKYPH